MTSDEERGRVRYGNNKMGKYRALLRNKALARHLPPTKLATLDNIRGMLQRYSSVYLKPSHGTGGSGIFKLSRTKEGYRLRSGTRSRTFGSLGGAFAAYNRAKAKKIYLVQMGIPLLSYKNRPFDLRIMVQRNPRRAWEATGIVGRLAKPHKIVTNYHSGGKPMPADVLLASAIPAGKRARYRAQLQTLGLRISRHMSGYFPGFRAYGVDVGIDKSLKPWIIEVNSRPDKSIFNALTDKRMYLKIVRYSRVR